jgi:hypothetical protein
MSYSTEQVVACWEKNGGNVSATARELKLRSRATVLHHIRKAGKVKPIAGGRVKAVQIEKRPKPKSGRIHYYLLTSAQNNTYVHDAHWENLMALRKDLGAELLVGTFSYNMNSYGELAVKRGTKGEYQRELWYDDRLKPYIEAGDNRNIEIAPNLVWCGRANILPTAERPLLGFESYTNRSSGIFPHVKQDMESVASGKFEATKLNFTTGTVTQQNYLQKKAGLKAEHTHCYGALLVAATEDGRWYVRQLVTDDDGVMYDLTRKIDNGKISGGHRVEAINWGDVHSATLEDEVFELAFGKGGMLDTLRPKYQFFHDTVDFKGRNPHSFQVRGGQPRERFLNYCEGFDSVEDEMKQACDFLDSTRRPWCQSIVVNSNHDEFFTGWLDWADHRKDPINARFFLHASTFLYDFMHEHRKQPLMLRWCFERLLGVRPNLEFLGLDQSFVICKQHKGGIECGMHGDDGPNGAPGSEVGFERMGRRVNVGHKHTSSLRQWGVGYAGLLGRLDQGYNHGPGSWSQTQILTYPNSTRCAVTFWKNAWRE